MFYHDINNEVIQATVFYCFVLFCILSGNPILSDHNHLSLDVRTSGIFKTPLNSTLKHLTKWVPCILKFFCASFQEICRCSEGVFLSSVQWSSANSFQTLSVGWCKHKCCILMKALDPHLKRGSHISLRCKLRSHKMRHKYYLQQFMQAVTNYSLHMIRACDLFKS